MVDPHSDPMLLPRDIQKAAAVSLLAGRLGLPIGNPWQSLTVGADIRSIGEALGVLSNAEIGFAAHADIATAQQMRIYSTAWRPFPPPGYTNLRHSTFVGLPTEPYEVGPYDFNVLKLPDGYLCHYLEAPVVIAGDGKTVVSDYSSNYSGLIHFHPQRLRDCLAEAPYIDGAVVPIADDVQDGNFCHWIVDWLPRLAFLGPRLRDRKLFIVVSRLAAPFQTETLRLLGVAPEQIIELPNFAAIRARELLVPSNLGMAIHPGLTAAPWVLSFLQSTLGLAALREVSEGGAPGERLYISRQDAAGRRILNEPDLTPHLAAAGYRTVLLSRLPLVQQIATVARAERLVGLHGAGLTHAVFMPPGARLLEILPASYAIPTYYALAAGAGIDYTSYVAEQVVAASDRSYDDVRVDIGDFARCCREFYD